MTEILNRPTQLLSLVILALCATPQEKALAGNPILKDSEPGYIQLEVEGDF